MEITNRQLISDIISELRSMNIDDRISYRFILSRLKDKTRLFVKQDLDSRRLFKITSIWKPINCIDLCPVSAIECGCDIPNCEVVMKSKIKIPKTFDTTYGTLLKILTIDKKSEYKQTTPIEYIDLMKRPFASKKFKYFWIEDEYIVIPNSKVENVYGIGLFENPHEIDNINGVSDCIKPLDSLFPCPGHLLDIVKKETIIELAKILKGIPEDEKPNQNSNIKA